MGAQGAVSKNRTSLDPSVNIGCARLLSHTAYGAYPQVQAFQNSVAFVSAAFGGSGIQVNGTWFAPVNGAINENSVGAIKQMPGNENSVGAIKQMPSHENSVGDGHIPFMQGPVGSSFHHGPTRPIFSTAEHATTGQISGLGTEGFVTKSRVVECGHGHGKPKICDPQYLIRPSSSLAYYARMNRLGENLHSGEASMSATGAYNEANISGYT